MHSRLCGLPRKSRPVAQWRQLLRYNTAPPLSATPPIALPLCRPVNSILIQPRIDRHVWKHPNKEHPMMRTMLRNLRRDMEYFYSPSFTHHTSIDFATFHAARYYNKRGSRSSRVTKSCVFVTNNGEADEAPISGAVRSCL